jgi:phage host-nuclease inhibitor protein Gam
MTKKTRLKSSAVEHWVPADSTQVAEAIKEIGFHQNERKRIEATMNDELLKVRAGYESDAKAHKERMDELMKGVQLYCEANRALITKDGKTKTVSFATGEVSWRLRPPSIVIRNAAALVEVLKARLLTRFLRVKEEIDREAMGKDLDIARELPGVTVSQKEDFVVKPFESELEEVQS